MQCRENENILDITATGNQVFSLTEGRLPQQMLEGKNNQTTYTNLLNIKVNNRKTEIRS